MGRVVLAYDQERGEEVALKFLTGSQPQAADLFRREVELLAQLSHPNLIGIYDYFASSENGPFFSMELAPGRPLDTALSRLAPERILDLFVKVAHGLHYLHVRQILHRDLKPENIHWDDQGNVKILDYGIAGVHGFKDGLIVGTPAYMAPESLKGDFFPESDLFSLGVIFYRLLSGRRPFEKVPDLRSPSPPPLAQLRPELPKPFTTLIDRMIRPDPRQRPASAAGALRYLREHGVKGADLSQAGGEQPSYAKIPWVARDEEIAVDHAARKSKTEFVVLRVTGPTGVGRTRLLQEFKIRWQLEGLALGEDVFLFEDLHLLPEEFLQDLQITLHELRGRRRAGLVVLEDNADFAPTELSRLVDRFVTCTVVLNDLPPEASLRLLENAVADLEKKPELEKIITASGGRPLLLIEGLKQSSGTGRPLPLSLEEACRRYMEDLEPQARLAVSVVLAAVEPPSWDDAVKVAAGLGLEDSKWFWELHRLGFLKRHTSDPRRLQWVHASLCGAYEKALSRDERDAAHRAWLKILPEKPAYPVVYHALALGDAKSLGLAQDKKQAALDELFFAGRMEAALALEKQLLESVRSDEDRYVLHAYRANCLYRLGRFDEALRAYDDWFAVRPDDGTGLIPLRYRLHRSQVLLVAGRSQEARREIDAALAEGDSGRFAHHRPYHAQAHLLMATLEEREGHRQEARRELQKARNLVTGIDSAREVMGEIEYRDAQLLQSSSAWEEAVACLEKALEFCRASGNSQIEATLVNAMAMLERARGNLDTADRLMDKALALAEAGGERIQIASFRQNKALLHLDRGEGRKAKSLMDKAEAVLATLGKPEERLFAGLHRLSLLTLSRDRELIDAALSGLRSQLGPEDHPLLKAHLDLAEAEARYALKDYDEALRLYGQAETSFDAMNDKNARFEALMGRHRAALRFNRPLSQGELEEAKGPGPTLWREVFSFIGDKAPKPGLPGLWDRIRKNPFPALKADLYQILSIHLRRSGFARLSGAFEDAANKENFFIFKNLPEEYQLSMETNKDLSHFEKTLVEMGGGGTAGKRSISENRFRQFCAVSRQVVQKKNPAEILERMMDAALEMTGAERGFILIKSEEAEDSPLPGFEVKTARHMNQRALHEKEFQLSLTTVKDVIAKGIPTLTNDAQIDPRFQEKKSVVVQGLKSILVVPLERDGEVIGALYLDHRYQADCFSDEDVTVLTAFAALCSLALENARILSELAQAKQALEGRVQDQTVKIQDLETELEKRRTDLKFGYEEIIGQSRPMMKVFRALDNITETNVPVWIYGESGTGKELIAKSLHYNSQRKDGPFVAENVSAIPETLLESELFGHKKGAFTHADRDRVGLFEQASGGTLFLDEIADMSPSMQVKLLRVLQEGEVRPVGSGKKVKVDVRLVTASNKDLRKLVKAGKFREDLFYRINGMAITLPSLCDRKEDIPLLVTHLIERAAKSLGLPVSEVDQEAMDLLLKHDWPGNVRELEATLRNALVFARGKMITAAHLKSNEDLMASMKRKVTIPEAHEESKMVESKAEKELLVETLRRHRMDKKATANEMGVSLKTLYARMAVHNIPKKKTVLAGFLGLR